MSTRTSIAASLIAVVITAAPASAESITVTLTDPAGDVRLGTPGYVDIVQAQATRKGQTFEFTMDLVAPIPADPGPLPQGTKKIWWAWGLDTDPATAPAGTPASPGIGLAPEYGVRVQWDGASFSGAFYDRRPLLTGGEAIITPLPFVISSNRVSMSVRASAVGNPSSFMWDSTTIYFNADHASVGWFNFDGFDPFFNPWP